MRLFIVILQSKQGLNLNKYSILLSVQQVQTWDIIRRLDHLRVEYWKIMVMMMKEKAHN